MERHQQSKIYLMRLVLSVREILTVVFVVSPRLASCFNLTTRSLNEFSFNSFGRLPLIVVSDLIGESLIYWFCRIDLIVYCYMHSTNTFNLD